MDTQSGPRRAIGCLGMLILGYVLTFMGLGPAVRGIEKVWYATCSRSNAPRQCQSTVRNNIKDVGRLSTLAAIVLVPIGVSVIRSRRANADERRREKAAKERYRQKHGEYPPSTGRTIVVAIIAALGLPFLVQMVLQDGGKATLTLGQLAAMSLAVFVLVVGLASAVAKAKTRRPLTEEEKAALLVGGVIAGGLFLGFLKKRGARHAAQQAEAQRTLALRAARQREAAQQAAAQRAAAQQAAQQVAAQRTAQQAAQRAAAQQAAAQQAAAQHVSQPTPMRREPSISSADDDRAARKAFFHDIAMKEEGWRENLRD